MTRSNAQANENQAFHRSLGGYFAVAGLVLFLTAFPVDALNAFDPLVPTMMVFAGVALVILGIAKSLLHPKPSNR
ncbi:MAG: hypothetical protein K0S68_310 [Candidatus Saccharibacteria bacterium]|nr:hypothetical protein [Candidatus Saccharibacteria bacterium]